MAKNKKAMQKLKPLNEKLMREIEQLLAASAERLESTTTELNEVDLSLLCVVKETDEKKNDLLDSLKGSHDYQDSETNFLPCVKAIDGKYSKVVKHGDILSTDSDSIKETNLEQYFLGAVYSEASKSMKPSRKFGEQNGTLPNQLWQTKTSVPGSSSPMKKD